MEILNSILVGAALVLSVLALLVASSAHVRAEGAWRVIERLALERKQCICGAYSEMDTQCKAH